MVLLLGVEKGISLKIRIIIRIQITKNIQEPKHETLKQQPIRLTKDKTDVKLQ
jgi:hypothetical protein